MEKEFIPYELAFRMKALGYDEPCLSVYISAEKLRVPTKFSIVNNILNGEYNDDFIPVIKCVAPTWQQAFRWFREKYNLNSFCKQLELNGKSYWKISKIETTDKIKGYSNFTNSYEEAEFECLKKLIEIIENQK
jgi:hypothetical protein